MTDAELVKFAARHALKVAYVDDAVTGSGRAEPFFSLKRADGKMLCLAPEQVETMRSEELTAIIREPRVVRRRGACRVHRSG